MKELTEEQKAWVQRILGSEWFRSIAEQDRTCRPDDYIVRAIPLDPPTETIQWSEDADVEKW